MLRADLPDPIATHPDAHYVCFGSTQDGMAHDSKQECTWLSLRCNLELMQWVPHRKPNSQMQASDATASSSFLRNMLRAFQKLATRGAADCHEAMWDVTSMPDGMPLWTAARTRSPAKRGGLVVLPSTTA